MFSTKKRIIFSFGLLILVLMLSVIIVYHRAVNIATPNEIIDNIVRDKPECENKPVVYVGVISRYPPTMIYQGYQPIMDYLTANSNWCFQLKLSTSYENTVKQLRSGEVSAAFLGSLIYVRMRKNNEIKCLLKPLNDNAEPFFQSVLITGSSSSIYSISDLKGKKLALPSEHSYSGNWLLSYALQKYGLDISGLDSIRHFPHHQNVVYEVMRGKFDAGVVKDRVAKDFLKQGIRVFAFSDPVPGSPLVIASQTNPEVVRTLRELLLKIDVNQPEYAELVSDWDSEFAYGFVSASDDDYDSIEKILSKIKFEDE